MPRDPSTRSSSKQDDDPYMSLFAETMSRATVRAESEVAALERGPTSSRATEREPSVDTVSKRDPSMSRATDREPPEDPAPERDTTMLSSGERKQVEATVLRQLDGVFDSTGYKETSQTDRNWVKEELVSAVIAGKMATSVAAHVDAVVPIMLGVLPEKTSKHKSYDEAVKELQPKRRSSRLAACNLRS